MQLVMATLVKSLPQIGNVALFGLFQFVVFGILGVQLFAESFGDAPTPRRRTSTSASGRSSAPDGTAGERSGQTSSSTSITSDGRC